MVIRTQRFCEQIWENIDGHGYGQQPKSLLPTVPKSIYIENTINNLGQQPMKKAYPLKLYPNKSKAKELDRLIEFYRAEVNCKIRLFWDFKEVKGAYPPKEYCRGGRLVRDASQRAWDIVRVAKKEEEDKEPWFTADEIDINEFSGKVIEGFKTKEFDMWLNIISVDSKQGMGNSKRIKVPCKRYEKFNEACKEGKLKKSFKLKKIRGEYYAIFFVEFPEVKRVNDKVIGLDVGLNHTVATSDGKFFGEDLKDLRIRTKWRHYKKGLSAFKQGLNRVAKELVSTYKGCDFTVEKLLFKGKRGRSKRFRRRNKNWAYAYLSHKLEEIGSLEGFQVLYVNPRDTSLRCPQCGEVSKSNRRGELFHCVRCGYTNHADTVGAINIVLKSRRELSVPLANSLGTDPRAVKNKRGGELERYLRKLANCERRGVGEIEARCEGGEREKC